MTSKKTHSGGATKRVSRKKPETPLIQLVRPQIFPIVGIGASAGGLEAFKQLLEHLPTDTGMAFIILQHLDPRHESILSELLSTATDMPVKEATNDLRVEPDHVYVMPSNTNMTIARGVLRLEPREETRGRRRPIDHFLRSLAEANGSRAIGVILSGTASDGALGLKAIKAEGGITFAQDEKTARYYGMPRSAINAGCVDFELPPGRIAEELARLASSPQAGAVGAPWRKESLRPDQKSGARAASLDEFLWLARGVSGVNFEHYKPDYVQQSVTRRMRLLEFDGLGAYADYLCEHNEEAEKLYRDILTGVTGFFRAPETFESLKEKVFPELVKKRGGDEPARVWIVGCSTGEDAYSTAIAFLEFTETHAKHIPIKIFATDPFDNAIALARAGLYSQRIVKDVAPERLRRFFVKTIDGYQISKLVRGMCVFARHNPLTDPPFLNLDLVSCRIPLSRLDPFMQKKAIHTLHYALKPTGYLLFGSPEQVVPGANLFKLEDEKLKIYTRIPGQSFWQFKFLPGDDSMEKVGAGRRAIRAIEEDDEDSAELRVAGKAKAAKAGRGQEANRGQQSAKLYEAQLRRKLQATREYLRSVIEQHEISAEELQTANEELQSSNEELQCISEELETAKQELQLRNAQLRRDKEKLLMQTKLIESSVEPIFVWDPGKHIVEWNQGCERFYGYTRAEAVGRDNYELLRTVHPLPLEKFMSTLEEQGEWTGELRQKTKDGREVIVESRTTLTEINGRRLALVTNRDITERKRAELNTQFINRLDLALSRASDADEIIRLATGKLGEYLGVSHCYISKIDPAVRFAVVPENWEGWLQGASSVAGEYRIGDFVTPELSGEFEAGKVLAVNDVETDPRTRDFSARYKPIRVGAFASVPMLNEKRWEATLSVHQAQSRDWRPDELQLMRDVAARLWPAAKRAMAEKALRQSEERARRTLVDQMVAGVAECDSEGKFTQANQRYCDITGYTRTELLEMRIEDLWRPDDWRRFGDLYRRLFENGESCFIEKRYRRKDGSEVWVNSHVSPLRNATGQIEAAVAVAIDVTDRKRAEKELLAANSRLAEDLEATTRLQRISEIFMREGDLASALGEIVEAAIQISGADKGNIQLFDAASGNLNIAEQRGFGQPFLDYWNSVHEGKGACGTALKRGERVIIEDVTHSPIFAGTHDVDVLSQEGVRAVQSTPVTNRSGELLAVFSTHYLAARRPDERSLRWLDLLSRQIGDMIERTQAEASLRSAYERAEAATRAKDEFLTVVSHELRSPLNSILGYVRLMRTGSMNAAQLEQTFGIIERNGRTQLQLIEDLLDTARIISGKLELEVQPVDLIGVITAALDVVQPSAQAKGIMLVSNLDPLAGQITGDYDRLQQVVWNLLSNAIKFTSEGGRVEIILRRSDPHVAIIVRDTGKGIQPDFLQHIFERFRQSDMSSTRRVGGLGLGLSLVKQLVELHGGTIEAESEGAGQGATFTIRLPLRAVYAAPPEEPKAFDVMARSRAESLAGLRALLVDDVEEVRTLLTLTLQTYGAEALAVASGMEALELLARQTPEEHVDVLICDIAMPDEDGYAVMRKVRALPPDKGGAIPAIALTAYGRAEDRVRALAAGFQTHVAKPVEPDELAVVILSLIKRFNSTPES